jgi:hypothetical protein
MEQTSQAPQGRGMAIAGFVIALVALVFYFVVAGIVTVQAALGGGYGLGIFWLIVSLLGTGLSVMGMMKLGKTGGKKGLAIAGMVIGIVALILTVMLVLGIGKIQEASTKFGDEFGDKFKQEMEKATQELQEDMNHSLDSLSETH